MPGAVSCPAALPEAAWRVRARESHWGAGVERGAMGRVTSLGARGALEGRNGMGGDREQ